MTEVEARRKEIDRLYARPVTIQMVRRAMRALVDYNWADEEDDFLHGEHTATLSQHILSSLIVLDKWLTGRKKL